jgi:hypothetical protein
LAAPQNISLKSSPHICEVPVKEDMLMPDITERTITEDLLDGDFLNNDMEVIECRNNRERGNMKHMDIFHKMFP